MGNPFVHVDLSTTDVAAAKRFYQAVFDWKLTDMPAMDWTGIDVGEGAGGGISKVQAPGELPSWTAFAEVDDVRATMAKVRAAGGTVVVEHMQIGDMGAIGVFVDPQGATLGVWAPAKKAPPTKAPAKKKPAKKAAAKKSAAKKPSKKASGKKAGKPARRR